MKKIKLTPEQKAQGYHIRAGFLYDKNHTRNRWDLADFSINEAIRASESLKNCKECVNCENCDDCTNCTSCNNCEDCVDCVGCHNCTNKKYHIPIMLARRT